MNLPSMTMMDSLEGPGIINLCDGSWQAGVRSEWEVQQDDSSSSEQIHTGLPVSGTKRKPNRTVGVSSSNRSVILSVVVNLGFHGDAGRGEEAGQNRDVEAGGEGGAHHE